MGGFVLSYLEKRFLHEKRLSAGNRLGRNFLIKNLDQYDEISFQHSEETERNEQNRHRDRKALALHPLLFWASGFEHPRHQLQRRPRPQSQKPGLQKMMITIPREVVVDLIRDLPDLLINVFCEIEDEIFSWKYTPKSAPTSM